MVTITPPACESAERLRLAMEHSLIGMSTVAPDGRYLEVNQALCFMLDREQDELLAIDWRTITHPDDLEASERLARDVVEGRRDAFRQLKRYLRRDGSVLWGDLSVAAVRDETGAVRSFVSQIMDVTERIEMEDALRASEERYRALVGEIDGVVVVHDLVTRTAFCSAQVFDLLGFPAETMVLPGAWESLVVEEDAERAMLFWEHTDGSDEHDIEYRMRRADAKVIWVEERWRAIRDDNGTIVRWSSVVTDVTARKRLEETVSRTDRLEAVSRVAAAAAQGFGDVLAAIQYAQGNLADTVEPGGPAADDVHAIGEAVRRGIQLTRQLLAFGRDREDTEPAPLDVAWLLADLEPILQGVAGTAELEIEVAANGLARIARSGLEQAVLNLVINARDALPVGGSIRITVDRETVRPDDGLGVPAGPYLSIAVADTGTGMSREHAQRAFEPFYTTKPHGSGLGLPSVYATMRGIGGTVRIDSRVDEGTTIWLLLPEAAPAATAATVASAVTLETVEGPATAPAP